MVAEPQWIIRKTVQFVLTVQMQEHGGLEGVRDEIALDRALDRPRNSYSYRNPKPTIPELAAEYAFGICLNHPFVDGNKRVALSVAETFLSINGYKCTAEPAEKYTFYLEWESGEMGPEACVSWFKTRSVKDKS